MVFCDLDRLSRDFNDYDYKKDNDEQVGDVAQLHKETHVLVECGDHCGDYSEQIDEHGEQNDHWQVASRCWSPRRCRVYS